MDREVKSLMSFVKMIFMCLIGFAAVVAIPVAIYFIVKLAAYLIHIAG